MSGSVERSHWQFKAAKASLTCLLLHSGPWRRHGFGPDGRAGHHNMKNKMTKEAWIALFKEAGLEEAAQQRWHQLFESRHPEAHESFLRWLGLESQAVERIRQASR